MASDFSTDPSAGIPIISMAAMRRDDVSAGVDTSRADPSRADVPRQLRRACEDRGFFYIVDHGLPAALTDGVLAQTRAFFAQPIDAKLGLDKSRSACNRGYEPLRAQRLQAGAPPDLKESFYVGEEVTADDPRVRAGRFNTGPNQWPTGLPGFRETLTAYFTAAQGLTATLVRALAQSLDLPEGAFDAYLTGAASTLRLLHYPPQPPQPLPGERGCGEHTDFGGITLLLQDEVGGLQVRDAAGDRWIDAPPIPGSFVVNLGDLFARWTNERYRSTLHRVVNTSGRERHSVPFFFTGNPTYRVECLPTCLAPGELPRFAPVTVEEHLRECYRRTYA